ncbi:MAG: hypothetical protein Q9221_008233 [Calogaya cf. arnoldii]
MNSNNSDDKEAEGHDRETYEHQLQLSLTQSKIPSRPRACDDTAFFVFKLGPPFADIKSLQSAVGVSATLRKGLGEEGDADFAHPSDSRNRFEPSPTQTARHVPAQMEYPVWYLFYGTLADPETLRECITLPSTPRLVPASTKGGVLRSWGRKYKALVNGPADARIDGFAYLVETADHEEYLRFRETEAYEVVRCPITFEGGEEVQGLTFRFVKQEDLDLD